MVVKPDRAICSMTEFLDQFESLLQARGYCALCGVDEVGRGPLAGPVVAAAVIFPPDITIEDLDDSKKLTPLRREKVFDRIVQLGLRCAVGIIDHQTIDQVNIHKASLMAMRKAVMDLKAAPDVVLVDGNAAIPGISQPQYTIIGGDRCCKSIAAASVVAKVTRDRIMDRYEALYPSFSFSTHKGYPTAGHRRELEEFGPCEIHRRSFRPVANAVQDLALLR